MRHRIRITNARSVGALAAVAALAATLACASQLPTVQDVAPGEPLPIDGVWTETTLKARLQIGAGRIWAVDPYVSGGVWNVSPGQVEITSVKRTGPRTFVGWNVAYKGPYYLHLLDENRIAVMLRTPLAGDYTAIMTKSSVDDPQAFAAELAKPAPAAPWEDPLVMSGQQLANLQQNQQQQLRNQAQSAPAAPAAPKPPTSLEPAPFSVPAGTDFGNYHALLIGNNGYRQLPKLRSAGSDVAAVATVLRDRYRFETTILEDASRDDVLLALERYRRELGANDNLLIYYAGHGWLDEDADEGYWLPVDASPDSSINWIPNATLTSSFKAIRAKHVLVVADSCYSGKLTRGIAVRANRPPDYIKRMSEKRARMVISSGGLEPVLDGGRGNHSVFAAAFLDALRENDGVIDTTSLFSKIRRDVMLHAEQTPELADIRKSGHEGGDFLFVPR
jgi:hypothetical protein